MRKRSGLLVAFLFAGALAMPVLIGGCEEHGYVRVYDPYYHDYHRWNRDEVVFYGRWENETHREHREFRERNEGEQHEYWEWRHKHH
jgi:hypothetical protein